MEMLEFIFSLEDRSKNIASSLTIVKEEIEECFPEIPEESLKIQASLSYICRNLTDILKFLEIVDSPLYQLKARLGKTNSMIEKSGVKSFAEDQRLLLKRIGMNDELVNDAVSYIEENRDLIFQSNNVDIKKLLLNIRRYRNGVCAISERIDLVYSAIQGRLINTIVEGCIGVCIVVADVTGAFTVPDPTAFTFIKSMKSTIIGSKKINDSIEEMLPFITEASLENMLNNQPGPGIRRRDN